jgi:tetraacyldisaccharide 4'-kinase
MDEAALHDLLSGRRRDLSARILRGALSMASWGYTLATGLRNRAYEQGWLPIHRASVPVISLGNITTGGTGKTPTAAWLANWLLAQGVRPGLLSRGYRSLQPDPQGMAPAGNDEKLVLDRLCPFVPHLQQRDRVTSAERLVREFDCNVLILDDGFQHRRLHRDLDLVLIDALQPWGFRHVLPRGLLRESIKGIQRASLVLLTRSDQCSADDKQRLREELRSLRGSDECVEVAFVPTRLVSVDGQESSLHSVAGQRVHSFCGIGNPAGFRQTLATLGVSTELQVFPDHHHYGPADLQELQSRSRAAGVQLVLTTLKDLVKIPPDGWSGPPLFAVEIGVRFEAAEQLLVNQIRQAVWPSQQTSFDSK